MLGNLGRTAVGFQHLEDVSRLLFLRFLFQFRVVFFRTVKSITFEAMYIKTFEKMKTRVLMLTLLSMALLSSCSMYHPRMVDIPLIKEKNELKIDGNLSASGTIVIPESVDANVTVSYGVTNWMAAQAYVGYNFEKNYYMQGAVGAYKPIDKFVVEGYLGAGFGHNYVVSKKDEGERRYYGNYNVFFGQLNLGWTDLTAVNIDLGVGLKGGMLFPDFIDATVDEEGIETVYQTHTTPNPLFEPQVLFRIGSKNLKFSLKAGYVELFDADFYLNPFTLGLGVNYRF